MVGSYMEVYNWWKTANVDRSGRAIGLVLLLFFFQAEDGIRDTSVTGVQTCALPISIFPARTRWAEDWARASRRNASTSTTICSTTSTGRIGEEPAEYSFKSPTAVRPRTTSS